MPPEVVEAISQLNRSDARDVMRDHRGYSDWERRRSYETSLSVFEKSVSDFFAPSDSSKTHPVMEPFSTEHEREN